tara:strand:+ start:1295 stop:1471 length:177 start_codon:yes stop_codon:yes gene_type:complete
MRYTMQGEVKVILEVEIDFDVVPDAEELTSVLLSIEDLSPDFKKRVAEGKFVYAMRNK